MNSIIVLLFAVAAVVIGYVKYGRNIIQKKLVEPIDDTPTPAHTKNDGMDYHPAPKMVLFGHHFSSIAGAGPIVGPIVAVAAYGWGPAFLWLLVAGIFIGAVHDYLSLILSERNGGASIPDTAQKYVSKNARRLFIIFVWLTLVLVVAVFGNFAAKAMISKPELVLPTFLLIPLAIGFGYLEKHKIVPLTVNTVFAILGLILLIALGFYAPVSLPFSPQTAYIIWFSLLMIYGYAASVTPVWILLQPRDYISSWVLIIGIVLAFIGVFDDHPVMNAPFITGFMNSEQGPMIPFLFIIIACGAVSGFHSIIAGGTTSKQLGREKDALPVAYGGMLTETVIGVICVIIAGGALMWGKNAGQLHAVLAAGGPLAVFGTGFGSLTDFLFGQNLGSLIGITIVNIFIMTTLDTSIRLGRFLTHEMVFTRKHKALHNKYILTLLPVIPAFLIGISDSWKKIWPVFGSANQLVAALVFIILTSWLYKNGKPVKYTLYATLFMLSVTLIALVILILKFFSSPHPDYLLGILSGILIALSLLMAKEGWQGYLATRKTYHTHLPGK